MVQQPAVAEIVDVARRIQAREQSERLAPAVGARDGALEFAPRCGIAADSRDVEQFGAIQRQRLAGDAAGKLQRQHAHADEIGTMDPLERFSDHRAHPEQARALRGPVARRSGAVFDACDHHERHPFGPVPLRGGVERHASAIRVMHGAAALDARGHLVADADVGEGAADHHVVVQAPRRVIDEIARRDAERRQVSGSRRALGDGADRRDVVGGEHVAEHAEHACAGNVLNWTCLSFHKIKKGRSPDERAPRLPRESLASAARQRAPLRRALEESCVALAEQRRREDFADDPADFRIFGPDLAQVYRLAVAVLAERRGGKIGEHAARERIGHDQRRRGEEIRAHRGMDAALEIAVARQDGNRRQAAGFDGLCHRGGQRAGVSHAGHAAEARQLEAECVQRYLQAALRKIVGDHARTRRQRRLHPGTRLQPARNRIARKQAGADHHGWVGGVGATRYRRDDDVAVS